MRSPTVQESAQAAWAFGAVFFVVTLSIRVLFMLSRTLLAGVLHNDVIDGLLLITAILVPYPFGYVMTRRVMRGPRAPGAERRPYASWIAGAIMVAPPVLSAILGASWVFVLGSAAAGAWLVQWSVGIWVLWRRRSRLLVLPMVATVIAGLYLWSAGGTWLLILGGMLSIDLLLVSIFVSAWSAFQAATTSHELAPEGPE